jgi:hypothetical protein
MLAVSAECGRYRPIGIEDRYQMAYPSLAMFCQLLDAARLRASLACRSPGENKFGWPRVTIDAPTTSTSEPITGSQQSEHVAVSLCRARKLASGCLALPRVFRPRLSIKL